MMNFKKASDLIDTLRTKFYERLNRKTGWGKEELKMEFERAISDTFIASWDTKEKGEEEI